MRSVAYFFEKKQESVEKKSFNRTIGPEEDA